MRCFADKGPTSVLCGAQCYIPHSLHFLEEHRRVIRKLVSGQSLLRAQEEKLSPGNLSSHIQLWIITARTSLQRVCHLTEAKSRRRVSEPTNTKSSTLIFTLNQIQNADKASTVLPLMIQTEYYIHLTARWPYLISSVVPCLLSSSSPTSISSLTPLCRVSGGPTVRQQSVVKFHKYRHTCGDRFPLCPFSRLLTYPDTCGHEHPKRAEGWMVHTWTQIYVEDLKGGGHFRRLYLLFFSFLSPSSLISSYEPQQLPPRA